MRRAVWLLGLALGGCAGTETGNPSIDTQLALDAHSSNHQRVAIRASEGGITVERVWLSLGEIALLEGLDCDEDARRFTAPALGLADHAEPQPAVLDIGAAPGEYCGVSVDFVPSAEAPSAAPDALGDSVLLEGALSDGTPFSLAMAKPVNVMVAALNGSFALDDTQQALLLGFDLATWLADPGFANPAREADGSVRIDATHNPDLLQSFETALAAGLELYRDRDADAALDPEPELLGRGQ